MSRGSNSDTWMPLYIAKYERATSRLSLAEDGAYMRLIRDYWVNGPPPNDDVTLARILRVERREWVRIRPALEPFFEIRDGCWFHAKVERELGRAQEIIEKRREAGRQGGRPSKQTESKPKPNGFADGKQNETPAQVASPLPLPLPSEAVSEANASSVAELPLDGRGRGNPVRDAFDAWNELADRVGLPIARDLTDGRRKAIKARLAEAGPTGWAEALAAVERSRHCRGGNDRSWRADLDFITQPKSFTRLREGFYGADAKPIASPATDTVSRFAGPADLRAAVVEAMGESWTVSYLDPCRWADVPSRTLIAANAYAAGVIGKQIPDLLAEFEVRVLVEPTERKAG